MADDLRQRRLLPEIDHFAHQATSAQRPGFGFYTLMEHIGLFMLPHGEFLSSAKDQFTEIFPSRVAESGIEQRSPD
jgi:hypothetical protein